MMKLNKIAALALGAILIAATQVRAEDEAKGTIKSVDTTRNEVVLKGVVKDTIYELTKDAAVWLDGNRAKLADLKSDDKVVVLYDKKGEHFIATSVRALRSAQETTGTIRSQAEDRREITIKGTIKDTRYELTKDVTVWVAGKKGGMKDLKDGDEVRITYETRGDRHVANDIVVLKR